MSARDTELLNAISGIDGGDYIADTANHTGNWTGGIQVITECTFTTLTGNISGITTLPIGTYKGTFTVIKLSAGSLIAYK